MTMRLARHQLANAAALLLAIAQRCTGRPQRFLLVLSHMRSGSTLLHHLLQTNPEIIGAGESNRELHSTMDLQRLALWVRLNCGSLAGLRKRVTDQINHTRMLPDASLLQRPGLDVIFLVREPRGAIGSMVRDLGRYYGWTVEKLMDYYRERTDALCTLAAGIGQLRPRGAFALNYEALTGNPVASLESLRQHFALEMPFDTRYTLRQYSGRRGDPSGNIRSGTILPADRHAELQLDAAVEQDLRQHYARVIGTLSHHCRTDFQISSAHAQ